MKMRRACDTIILVASMAFTTSTQAQNYVAIEGHVGPCVGITYDVHVETWPGTLPALDTVVQTGSDCSYFLMYYPSSIGGLLNVSTSCDSGITFISDTASFTIGLLGGDTVVVDLACGGGSYDCNGVLNGPAMPGTACDDGNASTTNDAWNADCICLGGVYDCAGLFNGASTPGTPCLGMNVDSTFFFGTWSAQCVCIPDSNYLDCLGAENGPALPGTSCDDGNPLTFGDEWNANCVCMGNFIAPCQAMFMIVQAIGADSVPIPNDLWLFNLSNGGNGALSYFWDFGDSATSTESSPTHSYAGNGPYWLCLTVDDGQGCTDIYCDSVSVDDNGILSGVMGASGSRSTGFTVSVMDEQSVGVVDQLPTIGLSIWPNPVNEEVNVTFVNGSTGSVEITVLDMNGSIVTSQNAALIKGRVQLRVRTTDLGEGMYLLRLRNAGGVVSQRFVKVN